MTARDDSTMLECGHDLLELVAQVSDGTLPADPAHQADCPYCQEALAHLRVASGEIRAMADAPVTVPSGLARRVMAQLRRERGRVPIAGGPAGIDTASDIVVTQIVREAARAVEGVVECSVTLHPRVADGELALTIHLTALLGPALPELAEEVRAQVAADMLALTGLTTGPVEIVIDDIHVEG